MAAALLILINDNDDNYIKSDKNPTQQYQKMVKHTKRM
jgi:hypothetical protein